MDMRWVFNKTSPTRERARKYVGMQPKAALCTTRNSITSKGICVKPNIVRVRLKVRMA